MDKILQYVKQQGECLDTEIARVTKIPIESVQAQLSKLAAKYQVILCDSITFVKGKEFRSTICRVAGYIPPAKPGAKSKKQLML